MSQTDTLEYTAIVSYTLYMSFIAYCLIFSGNDTPPYTI
jgi:hypothetical protein